MVFYLHFNTSVFSKMLLVTCYFSFPPTNSISENCRGEVTVLKSLNDC